MFIKAMEKGNMINTKTMTSEMAQNQERQSI